jgi:hypothetical protein
LQDCLFAGSIEGSEVNSCGGLVGWATATGFISNCLMMGNMNISPNGGDVICRNNSRAILQDTYYISDWGAGIPYDAKSADQQSARSGELCYLLNAGRKDGNQAWFQTLNEDYHPVPDSSHLPVWYYEGAYINEDPDGIGNILINKQQEKTGIYDLSGRRIYGKPMQGIYIMNGRKVVR